MKKFKILIDMDDTITHLLPAWVSELNKTHNLQVEHSDICDWDMRLFYPTLSLSQIYEPLFDDNFWDNIEPISGAQKSIKKLIDDGHEIYIVTATHYAIAKAKFEKVLFKYFPFVSTPHIITTTNKQMIKGDILIDDAPHNVIGGDYLGFLMNAPHNQGFDAESNGVIRVYNWEEIYKLINNLSFKQ